VKGNVQMKAKRV